MEVSIFNALVYYPFLAYNLNLFWVNSINKIKENDMRTAVACLFVLAACLFIYPTVFKHALKFYVLGFCFAPLIISDWLFGTSEHPLDSFTTDNLQKRFTLTNDFKEVFTFTALYITFMFMRNLFSKAIKDTSATVVIQDETDKFTQTVASVSEADKLDGLQNLHVKREEGELVIQAATSRSGLLVQHGYTTFVAGEEPLGLRDLKVRRVQAIEDANGNTPKREEGCSLKFRLY